MLHVYTVISCIEHRSTSFLCVKEKTRMSIVIEVNIHDYHRKVGKLVCKPKQFPAAVSFVLTMYIQDDDDDDDDDDDVVQGSIIFTSCPNVRKIIPKMIAGYPFCHKGKIAESPRKLILGIHPNSAEA